MPKTIQIYVRAFLAAVFLQMLTACSTPTLSYQVVQKPTDGAGKPLMRIPTTLVTFAQPKDAAGKAQPSEKLSLDELRTEGKIVLSAAPSDNGPLIALDPKSGVWSNTQLNTAYYDNSRHLLKSVSVNFQDNVSKVIQVVGGILVDAKALAVAAIPPPAGVPAPSTLKVPFALDLGNQDAWLDLPPDVGPSPPAGASQAEQDAHDRQVQAFKAYDTAGWTPIVGSNGWYYRVIANAKERQESTDNICNFFGGNVTDDKCNLRTLHVSTNTSPNTGYIAGFPVSNCVDVEIQIDSDNLGASDHAVRFVTTVADPVYIRTMTLPEKGTISMHSVCGADLAVETSSTTELRAAQAIQAAFDQAKTVKTAQDKATTK